MKLRIMPYALVCLGFCWSCGALDPVHHSHPHMNPAGCSDGEREGFPNMTTHPDVAACAGGWSLPGVVHSVVMCDRVSGDDSDNPEGIACSAADLCARGWHLCATTQDFADHSFTGCDGLDAEDGEFYLSRQSGPGHGGCAGGDNDLFGCGTVGARPDASCTPFDRTSGNLCGALGSAWSCGSRSSHEASAVVKTQAHHGGVLCCRDF